MTNATGWANGVNSLSAGLLGRCGREHERPAPPRVSGKRRPPGRDRYGLVGVDGLDLGLVPAPQRVERAFGVDAAVGVRAEEVALALDQGGGQALRRRPS